MDDPQVRHSSTKPCHVHIELHDATNPVIEDLESSAVIVLSVEEPGSENLWLETEEGERVKLPEAGMTMYGTTMEVASMVAMLFRYVAERSDLMERVMQIEQVGERTTFDRTTRLR